ncbi:MAG: ubiquinol-cytochrome c reductase iron-sulfur subunit [Alphaproteobacteria bacterium]
MAETDGTTAHGGDDGETRRDFLQLATGALGAVGVASVAWPFIQQMNPAADTLALASIEVDISKIAVGQAIKVKWRGKPVFIRHRTQAEIQAAESAQMGDLVDPQADNARVKKPEWLVLVGVCTHLGCIPLGTAQGEAKGEYDGWFCPCHGSHYDTSGRIRKGPAPRNLEVPEYTFDANNPNIVKIG